VALAISSSGIVSETKYKKTRRIEIKTSDFATSNNIEKIIEPLQSRFFIVRLEPYTYEQFFDITVRLLTTISNQHSVDEDGNQPSLGISTPLLSLIRDCMVIDIMHLLTRYYDYYQFFTPNL
jgi:hypothetical protein